MGTIGIIGAMEVEVKELKEQMQITRQLTKAGMEFCEGILEGQDVVVVRSGVGKVNAAVCTQILIDVFDVKAVINTGIAGSLKAEINIGDLVISSDLVHHDMDAVSFGYPKGQIPQMDVFSFEADKALADLAEKAETYAMFHLKESMEQVTIRNQANCFDVSVAAYLLNPLKNNYTWEDVAREHLGLMIDEKIDQDMKACYESYVNYASVEVLRQKLRDTKMDTLFRDIEMPLVFTLFDMEQNGIRVEADALKQYGDQLAGKIAELEKEIYEEAGETFNINSPKQLGVVLFENMKLPGGRKTKTGYSTAADVLEKLAPEHPVVAKILEYRQYTKLLSLIHI